MQRKKYYVIAIAAATLGAVFAAVYWETQTCGGRPMIDDAEAWKVAKKSFGSDVKFWNGALGFATLDDFRNHLEDTPNCCELIRKSDFGLPYWHANFAKRRDDKIYVFALQVDRCGGTQNAGWVSGPAD